MIISVTGHRPSKLAWKTTSGYVEDNPLRCWIRERLREVLVEHKPLYGISGMALGVDQDFARACIDQGIPYVAAVPFVGQEHIWRPDAQATYRKLLELAREVVVVSEGGYAAWKMQARNQYLVDHCDLLVAVWDSSSGGTASCVGYAQRVQKPIHFIHPGDFHAKATRTSSAD